MIYLDTSAVVKLVRAEPESAMLSVYLAEHVAAPKASSALLYPELIRAVSRVRPELTVRSRGILQHICRMPISWGILEGAAVVVDPSVRTLDAIHLATATTIVQRLTAFVTYDKRLAEAARSLGLPVESPA